ncbi:MAG: hypothetical protein QM734_14440 [Cyclobacteriaceae bacterium]
MKRILVLLFILISPFAWSQKKKKNEKAEPAKQEAQQQQQAVQQPKPVEQPKDTVPQINPIIRHFAIKYQTALQWNDYDVAKDALYDLIIENPGNDSLIYELASFYYQNQKYPSAVLVSQELLRRNPKNIGALSISAIGYENIGAADRALQNYESLYLLSNEPATLYKMAFLQYQLKRYKESSTSIDILLADPQVEKLKVNYTGADNKAKEYAMRVALLNLKGLVAQDQGDKVGAKNFFNQALAIAPDFGPAKENAAKLK